MTRVAKIRADALGKVRVMIVLVGPKHSPVKGNMVRVLTIRDAKVSEIAARVQRSVFRVIGGIEKAAM